MIRRPVSSNTAKNRLLFTLADPIRGCHGHEIEQFGVMKSSLTTSLAAVGNAPLYAHSSSLLPSLQHLQEYHWRLLDVKHPLISRTTHHQLLSSDSRAIDLINATTSSLGHSISKVSIVFGGSMLTVAWHLFCYFIHLCDKR
jgi:hypothetical protein